MKMKLSTRLTLFFLAAHAVVLASFSVLLYVIAARYLERQVDERVESAINTIAAAVEIGPNGVEWEPEERRLTFPRRVVEGSFFWEIADQDGRRLDGPTPPASAPVLSELAKLRRLSRRPRSFVESSGTTWRVADRRISPLSRAPGALAPTIAEQGGIHPALWVRVGLSLDDAHATLRNLAAGLAVISATVFLLALALSHAFCRRAMRPVTEMANAAHAMNHAEPGEHLPSPQSGDELQELGQAFNSLLDRLSESFVRQKKFTGDASHQLRTPLTAMQGQIDLALKQDRDPQEYRRVLGVLQRKTRHLRQILDSLLYLARADAEALEPSVEPIDLAAWLPGQVAAWHDTRVAGDIRLLVERDRPVWSRAQPVLLGELLNNLVDNAAKYSDPGTPILVELARDGNMARITVEDHGIGMTGEEIAHVFEPFYRGKTAVDTGSSGLGLGLAVAARLARVFGGTIDVKSRVGRGSRFVVSLPLATEPHYPEPEVAPLEACGPPSVA
jgi:signal transduction histidine kinase